ncbi:OLC1v1011668C1 [Oldenlandia corymbosa var. corymbosa]|uniref:OLC1v1011668C1 n=1 Tax=Oldenlandia corymbosa var. corymbosa TaxID=529605 RepID=A0AAV1DU87_OLDCO|nr:OLC1v1011668C1 [Oldenlandia corymbosa var. corymbosa]
MAVSLTRFPWCWWGNKEKDPVSNGSSVNSLPDWGFGLKDPDNLKFRSITAAKKMASSKVKRKWKSREERRRVDKEYDVVLVPSDGVCLSGSESDDSDWSIGWLEPHAPDFQSDDDSGDDSFAVIVPCYRHHDYHQDVVDMEPKKHLLSAIQNLPNDYSTEGKKYMEQCLAILKDF